MISKVRDINPSTKRKFRPGGCREPFFYFIAAGSDPECRVIRIVDLPGDWSLKVTTSAYRTAAGELIDGIGIKPDLELKMPIAACRTEADTQMAQARQHVRHLAAGTASKS